MKKFQWGVAEHRITYDKAGMLGKDLTRYLEAKGIHGAIGYSGSMSGGKDFVNLRSLAAWRVRRRIDPDTSLPPPVDAKTGTHHPHAPRVKQEQYIIPPAAWYGSLREELSMLRYELLGGRTRLEPKEDLMQRLGRSPDLADALIQAHAWDT
jgi:hypothetical protein